MERDKKEVLITASEYIVNLKSGIKEAAELFQNYDEANGSALFYKIIDGLQWIMDMQVLTNISTNEEILEINKNFKTVVDAFENEDYVLVGDLLFYEIVPIMENIEIKINQYI